MWKSVIFSIRVLGGITIAVCLIFALLDNKTKNSFAQEHEVELPDIREFVRMAFIHGTPYKEVIRYEPAATTSILLELLRDPDFRAARAQIATTLGMLGDRRAIGPLIQLAEEGDGELSPTDYNAKTGAIGALGLALNREMDRRAFDYLTGLANMNSKSIDKLKWTSPYQADLDDRNTEISRTAIIALALSGQKEAEIFLDSLRQKDLRPALSAEMKNSLNATMKDALITNRVIQQGGKDGLKNYFNKETK